jgi:hypothetical protein
MKYNLILAFMFMSYVLHSQIIPYADFYGGYATRNKGLYGFGVGVDINRFIVGADVRMQTSYQPVLIGGKLGYLLPLIYDKKQALMLTVGGYIAKKNEQKQHISELGLTGAVRYYCWRIFYIEPYWQYSEEKHMAGINIGVTGWVK